MQLAMIGLGRMGANMVRRLIKGRHQCVVFDMFPKAVEELAREKQRMSLPCSLASQFRLFLHMGAYWLLHELRGAAPKRSIWRTATFETIRCAFLKIAVRIGGA
jgi:hypothetical protein